MTPTLNCLELTWRSEMIFRPTAIQRTSAIQRNQGVIRGKQGVLRSGVSETFDPLSLNPLLYYDAESSMVAPFEQPTLDLDPSNPSSLAPITATRAGVATYTDANGVVQTADPNTVRVDHVDGVPMILVEPAATNLVDYSNLDTTGIWYSVGFDITQNAILSPDGLTNGTKLEQKSTTRNLKGSFISSATGTSITYSFWIKKGSGSTHLNTFIIRNDTDGINQNGMINLETGEIILNEFGTGNLIVEAYPNGWFKVKATRDTGINIGDAIAIYPPHTSSDGTNEIGQYNYTFGHQLEYGSVATSYIPTNGSPVTRNADALVIEGSDFTDFYNSGGDGTFYAEAVFRQDDNGDSQSLLYGQSNSYRFLYGWDGRMRAYDGATLVITNPTSFTVGNLARTAVTFNSSTIGISLDGSTTVSGSHNGNLSYATELNVGNNGLNDYLNGYIKRLIYWPYHSDDL